MTQRSKRAPRSKTKVSETSAIGATGQVDHWADYATPDRQRPAEPAKSKRHPREVAADTPVRPVLFMHRFGGPAVIAANIEGIDQRIEELDRPFGETHWSSADYCVEWDAAARLLVDGPAAITCRRGTLTAAQEILSPKSALLGSIIEGEAEIELRDGERLSDVWVHRTQADAEAFLRADNGAAASEAMSMEEITPTENRIVCAVVSLWSSDAELRKERVAARNKKIVERMEKDWPLYDSKGKVPELAPDGTNKTIQKVLATFDFPSMKAIARNYRP